MKIGTKMKTICRVAGFVVLVLFMVFCLTMILRNHALSDTTGNSFFQQEYNTMDVIYMGNCHAYTSCMPSVVESITGMEGYVLATANQTAEMTYYYMQSALARQSPEYIVIEVFPFVVYDSYAAEGDALEVYFASAYADLPLKDKLSYLRQLRENGHSLRHLLFELSYFHGRWTDIQSFGYDLTAEDNGWLEWNEAGKEDKLDYPEQRLEVVQTEKRLGIDESYRIFVDNIIDLAEKANVKLIFVTVPYLEMSSDEAARYNTIADMAEMNNIPYLNFSKADLLESLDFRREHMMDKNHVNEAGARVVSEYLANYINALEQAEN